MSEEIALNYTRDFIDESASRQKNLRREFERKVFWEGRRDQVYSPNIYHLDDNTVPVLYLAGGMVPSIKKFHDPWIKKENWQYHLLEQTGAVINGDKGGYLSHIPNVRYGNFIAENPMENGPSSSRFFIDGDYIRILASHGSINFVQGGFNNEGNPGYAQLGEIAAQFAKGGLNIIYNQKGTLFRDHPFYEESAAFYDALRYQDECLVGSLDEAIDIVNKDGGDILRSLIKDSNEQHKKYKATVEERGKRAPVAFIGSSSKSPFGREVEKVLSGKGLDLILARDVVDPIEDPVTYLRLIDSCDLVVIHGNLSQSKGNLEHLQFGESAYAIMNRKPSFYISEQLEVMSKVAQEMPELEDRTVSVEVVNEKDSEIRRKRRLSDTYNLMGRLRGGDFIGGGAPFTHAYKTSEFGRAMHDVVFLMRK